jgi:hypothetical protein
MSSANMPPFGKTLRAFIWAPVSISIIQDTPSTWCGSSLTFMPSTVPSSSSSSSSSSGVSSSSLTFSDSSRVARELAASSSWFCCRFFLRPRVRGILSSSSSAPSRRALMFSCAWPESTYMYGSGAPNLFPSSRMAASGSKSSSSSSRAGLLIKGSGTITVCREPWGLRGLKPVLTGW